MDLKSIQEILKFVNKSDLTEVEIREGEFKLRVSKQSGQTVTMQTVPMTGMSNQQMMVAHETTTSAPQSNSEGAKKTEVSKEEEGDSSKLYTFNSPMIGTFYRSPSPEADVFVKVGDHVDTNQVICIVEAMKLFNEIECDVAGKIVKVLVENATPVEYDTPLFLIERA